MGLVEAGLQALLQGLSRFDNADVTRGDFLVLDRGSGPYVVMYQGGFQVRRPGEWSQVHYSWSTYVEVYAQYQDGGTSEQALEAAVQDVVDTVGANPTVGDVDGVTLSGVEYADDLTYVYLRGEREAPSFVMQRVRVRTEEDVLYDGSGEFV